MTATTPRGVVAQLVALAGHLQQRSALRELDGPARVVLEEVDRLADVGVGLAPRLRRLADLERGDLEPPLAQPLGGGDQHLGAPLGRRVRPRPRRARASASAASTSSGVADGGLGHDALGRAGVGGDQLVALAALVADPHRHAHRRPRVVLLQRARELRADRRPPQLEDRLVLELLHAVLGSGLASSSEIATPRACSCRNESLRRVLEQPPHEVGHAGHEVADRAVGAHAQALGGDRRLQRVAEPAQDLHLEVAVGAAGQPVVGDRVRDRAQVVRGDRGAQPAALGAVVDAARA